MKKLILSLIVGIMLISFTLAFEFDNIKSYDEVAKEVTFSNSFVGLPLGEIAKVKLNTPLEVLVIPGEDRKVAEFTINLIADEYVNPLKEIEFYYSDGTKFTREFTYKYLTYEDYEENENVYGEVCKDITIDNKTLEVKKICSQDVIDTKKVTKQREVWNNLDTSKLNKGIVTVGIFTDVKPSDYKIEWIPTMFGNLKVNEWATWSSGLSNGLVAYFTMNETGAGFIDNYRGRYNSTGGASLTYGKLNNSRSFDAGGADISGTSAGLQQNNFTWNGWFYGTGNQDFISSADKAYLGVFTGVISFYANGGTCSGWCKSSYSPGVGWYMVTLKYDTSGSMTICFNGTCGYTFSENTGWDKTNSVHLGYSSITAYGLGGADELGFWNRTLTNAEVTQLFNSGAGITYLTPYVASTLNSPADNYASALLTNQFNCTGETPLSTFKNNTLWTNLTGTWAQTNSTTTNGGNISATFTEGTYYWNCKTCDTDHLCGWGAANRTIRVDTTSPSITVTAPTGTFNGLTNGQNLTLNYNIVHPAAFLSTCWKDYNGANTTMNCSLNSSFTYVYGLNSIKVWANDTAGNRGSGTSTWTPTVTVANISYNTTVYVTSYESYVINLTGAATSVSLIYDGTTYSTTSSGNVYTNSRVLPTSVGNKSFYWSINSGAYNTSTYYQDVKDIFYDTCNATLNRPYMNITFKDEVNASTVFATLNPLTTYYSLTNLTAYKTFTQTNLVANASYPYCFIPNSSSLYTSTTAVVTASSYPTRYWSDILTLTNTTTNQTIYLLSTADGLYQNVIVATGNGIAISGATVSASSTTAGVVDERTTDTSGQVSLWLNPDSQYTLTTCATGYDCNVRIINPSSTSVTVTLGEALVFPPNNSVTYTEGVTWTILPNNDYLINNTLYNFNFTINHGTYGIDSFSISLFNSTNQLLQSALSTSNGGIINIGRNVGNDTKIIMIANWTSNGTTNTVSQSWGIMNDADTGYSILNFRDRLLTYIDSGLFGITRGFTLNIICFVIIFFTIGLISYKYSIDNPIMIVGMLTLLIAIFEWGLGLIHVDGRIGLTFWSLAVLAALAIKEAFV